MIVVGVDVPAVYYSEGRPGVSAKKRGIEHAMYNAVYLSDPGELIVQDDIEVLVDPHEAPAIAGIRTFAPPALPGHYCPRAFMYYDLHVKDRLLAAWNPERPNIPHGEYSCLAWRTILITADFLGIRQRLVPACSVLATTLPVALPPLPATKEQYELDT